ncbi:hypothetical protein GCM10009760_26080 [Kitasatospora kazusensis]|uniref:Uncharacterized protein n=1 Tax=Kitasatospora kazusensis TaxID=407974 RepID=A0ABP5L9C4_9ACTN
MRRETVVTGALVVLVGGAPAALMAALAMADPVNTRRWVWTCTALALAMIGVAFGPEQVEGWQRRRRARARVRARFHRSESKQQARL